MQALLTSGFRTQQRGLLHRSPRRPHVDMGADALWERALLTFGVVR